MSAVARLLVALSSPLRMLDARSKIIERILDLPLMDDDIRAIREACGNTRIGTYYHWYLQKLVIAKSIRKLDCDRIISMIRIMDHTNYSDVQSVIDSPAGVLIAIPHHAHYILSMTALAERLGQDRKVNVFYGQPTKHKGNHVFDHLHKVLFSDPATGVSVIHSNRQGLAASIKALKNGEVVFIMPDAFQDEDATLLLPFCGRLMNVMLGTAALARKTGSCILPVVSATSGNGLAFKTRFGLRLDPPKDSCSKSGVQAMACDYGLTRAIFNQFEQYMREELYLWQNVRNHIVNGVEADLVGLGELADLLDCVFKSPLVRAPDLVLDLT